MIQYRFLHGIAPEMMCTVSSPWTAVVCYGGVLTVERCTLEDVEIDEEQISKI